MADNCRGAVAVVDDDPAVLDSFKFIFEVVGHEVDIYASALAFLEDGGARSVCMILDQHMPQMTGLELAARLRREGSKIPILLITGAPSTTIVARANALGIEKVLEKPPTDGDLFAFVDAYFPACG
jgi:two-component system response regulator FixJ